MSQCESYLTLPLNCLFNILLHDIFFDLTVDHSLYPEHTGIRRILHRALNEIPHTFTLFPIALLPDCCRPFVLPFGLSIDKAVPQMNLPKALGLLAQIRLADAGKLQPVLELFHCQLLRR